jgi:microcystin-dependent protein
MDLYISTILEMAISWEPQTMMFCDGRKLEIKRHPALFSVLGTTYGGDGIDNFGIPDLRPLDQNGHRVNWDRDQIKKLIVVDGFYPTRD